MVMITTECNKCVDFVLVCTLALHAMKMQWMNHDLRIQVFYCSIMLRAVFILLGYLERYETPEMSTCYESSLLLAQNARTVR